MNTAHEATVLLPVQSRTGFTLAIEAVVDTGFSCFLTLPPPTVTELGLPLIGVNRSVLADGSETLFDVYGVIVLWDGRIRDVVTYAADATPLIGMALLHRHSLYVDVQDGGSVIIQAV